MKNGKGNTIGAQGIYFTMLDVLAKQLNFTYDVATPTSMGRKSNQQYQEMAQLLQQGEAFMSVTPFVMTESNLNKLALSEAVDLQQYAILYKRPEELSRITLFIRPYSPFVSFFKFLKLLANKKKII